MTELKSLYVSLGLENVTTYIQSGNVVFYSNENNESKLTNLISDKIRKIFGYDVSVIIRSKNEWQKLMANNPFLNRNNSDIKKMHVTILSQVPEKIDTEIFDQVKYNSEEYAIRGKEIYLYFPDGYGRTKLSNNFIENKLKIAATTRNWNTVMALNEMADSLDS